VDVEATFALQLSFEIIIFFISFGYEKNRKEIEFYRLIVV
jgi:hypothetical protein